MLARPPLSTYIYSIHSQQRTHEPLEVGKRLGEIGGRLRAVDLSALVGPAQRLRQRGALVLVEDLGGGGQGCRWVSGLGCG